MKHRNDWELMLFIIVIGALVIWFTGCTAARHCDPRARHLWEATAPVYAAGEARMRYEGPAPFWVEPSLSLTVIQCDGVTTKTIEARYGARAEPSTSLFKKLLTIVGIGVGGAVAQKEAAIIP